MTLGRSAVLLFTATVFAVARPSHAQSAGDGFLFRVPSFSWGVHAGFDRASAGSDLFAFVTRQLTLDRADFSSATFGSNLAIRLSPSNDLVFDVTYSSAPGVRNSATGSIKTTCQSSKPRRCAACRSR